MDYKSPLSEDNKKQEDVLNTEKIEKTEAEPVIMRDAVSQTVPEEIKRWNWGAFMLNISWGFGNKSYLPLLCLIPFFNIIWVFVCGFKGNEWAWKKGTFNSVEEFLAIQKTWNRAGIFSFIIFLVVLALYLVIIFAGIALFSSGMNDSSYYSY